MIARLAAQALLASAALALLWVGCAFAGYAIFLFSAPFAGEAGAAAIAAGFLLLVPGGGSAIFLYRGARRRKMLRTAAEVASCEGDPVLNLLANTAKDKPVIALLLAALIGAADSVSHRK